MGKKSTRNNKNVYQQSREEKGLTRFQASELMGFISESRIEKVESEKSPIHPEEVLAMAKVYKNPCLSNYYCAHECPIGIEHVPEVKLKGLSQIVLGMIATLNTLNKEKDRLIEITEDEEIVDDELMEFARIQNHLEKISLTVDTLKLWIANKVAAGDIDADKLAKARENI